MSHRSVTPLFPDNILPEPVDVDTALTLLGRMVRDRRPKISEIRDVVAEHFNVAPLDLDGPIRAMNLVMARHVCYYFARKFNGMSLADIGRRCGGRDHSSILYGVQRVERMVLNSPLIAQELEGLRLKIAERVLIRNARNNRHASKSN